MDQSSGGGGAVPCVPHLLDTLGLEGKCGSYMYQSSGGGGAVPCVPHLLDTLGLEGKCGPYMHHMWWGICTMCASPTGQSGVRR